LGHLLALRAVENAHLVCVVGIAIATLISKPVILDGGFCRAVIALDDSSGVVELLRHRLALDCLCQLLPLQFHVHCTLLAHWTFVCRRHIELIAPVMEIVAAWHRDNSTRGVEQVLAADGTVTVGGAF